MSYPSGTEANSAAASRACRALHEYRRKQERRTEEIDVVGTQRSIVTLVGECKWTSGRMTAKVLEDLERYKLPAMRQAGIRLAKDGPLIVLFSTSGFKDSLVEIANERADIRLVDVGTVVKDLTQ